MIGWPTLASGLLGHIGGVGGVGGNASVPPWLTIVTGGIIVGGSFLFVSLLTDHEGIRYVNALGVELPTTRTLERVFRGLLGLLGVLGLVVILVAAVEGPAVGSRNLAVLAVWMGWWAGYAMSTYLVGNTWPALNPWRTLASLFPERPTDTLPAGVGAWPSVVGLLAVVYVEVVTPLAADPRALGGIVVIYSALTLVGAFRYGSDTWFDQVDPVSRVFRLYGRAAPLQRTRDGIAVRLPTLALSDWHPADEPGGQAFVIALLWATTYDGLVTTAPWNDLAGGLLGAVGLSGIAYRAIVLAVYLIALLAGFALFLGAYRLASRYARETAESYRSAPSIGRWLVPSLVPIAAGYHLAHSLGYFLAWAPTLLEAIDPALWGVVVAQPTPLPAGFGTLQLAFVVLGHLLAVWIAHALAMDLFPGVLRPIRSQYPFVVVMVLYTMTSAFVIGQPFVEPVGL